MEVLVVGAGGIGAFLIFALAESGARVSVIETDASRRALAVSLGAAVVMPPPMPETLSAAGHESHPPELVYEVTGRPAGLAHALAALGRGTPMVVVGLQDRPAELDLRKLSISENQLIGTNALVAATDLPQALQLLGRRPGSWSDVAPTALALEDLVGDGIRPLALGQSTRVKTLIDPWAPATRRTQM